MQVTVTHYEIDGATKEGAAQYRALRAALEARGLRVFCVLADRQAPEGAYTVDAATLFDNQMNTREGRRLFDWFEESNAGRPRGYKIRRGYYLEAGEGFAALQAARAARLSCGYCGAQSEAAERDGAGPHWCDRCAGSEYLKESELRLLELRPVSEGLRATRDGAPPPWLIAEYRARQKAGAEARERRRLERALEDSARNVAAAQLEHAFRSALIEAGATAQDLENLIYYKHNGRFCFGWRGLVSFSDAQRLRAMLAAGPFGAFTVDIKAAPGVLRTKHATTARLSSGDGKAPRVIPVPAGTLCKACGDGSGDAFVSDLDALELNGFARHDAEHYGARVALSDCAES